MNDGGKVRFRSIYRIRVKRERRCSDENLVAMVLAVLRAHGFGVSLRREDRHRAAQSRHFFGSDNSDCPAFERSHIC